MSTWNEYVAEDICELVSVGIVVKPAQYYTTEETGVKAFRSANVREGKINDSEWVYITQEGHLKNSKSILREGDVLIVRSGAPGTSCVVSKEYVGSNCIDLVFARPKKNIILPEYLAIYLNSEAAKKHIAINKGGLALQHFNVGEFKKMKIVVPDIMSQQKIIEFDKTLNLFIEKKERIIHKKERLLEAYINKLISSSGDNRVPIKEFANEITARNKGSNLQLVLSVTNKNGFVLPEEKFKRRVASEDVSNYKVVKKGQYAYNPSRINVGSIARLDKWDAGILSPMYVVFELDNSKINSDYFFHWLNSSEAKQRIRLAAQGSVRETVSFDDFSNIEVPYPELSKQNKTARILNLMNEEIELQKLLLAKYRVQKKGLMQLFYNEDHKKETVYVQST